MAYAQGSDILAADYNGLINGATQFNTVWSVGTGDAGYGQTAIGTVSTATDVTATQWASLINALNSVRTHQIGPSATIGAPTAGTDITYLSTVTANISSAYINRASFISQGTTITGTNFVTYANAAAGAAYNQYVFTRTVRFLGGPDAARYFFNAGGQLNFVISSVSVVTASARSTDAQTLLATNLGGITAIRNATNGGRTGTGGTVATTNTALGYRGLTTAYQFISNIASTTAAYTTDKCNVAISSEGVKGVNGDLGANIFISVAFLSPGHSTFNSALGVGVNHRVDVIPPETTNLTNSWGTISIL